MIRIVTFAIAACSVLTFFASVPAEAYNKSLCMGYARQYGMLPGEKFCSLYRQAELVAGNAHAQACNEAKSSIKTDIDRAYTSTLATCQYTPQSAEACVQGVEEEHSRSLEANNFGYATCLKREFFK